MDKKLRVQKNTIFRGVGYSDPDCTPFYKDILLSYEIVTSFSLIKIPSCPEMPGFRVVTVFVLTQKVLFGIIINSKLIRHFV